VFSALVALAIWISTTLVLRLRQAAVDKELDR